jgi:RNA polymerase sigma-70 factor (ECF subfamily)
MSQVCIYEIEENNELPTPEKEEFFSRVYKDYWYKVFQYSYVYTGSRTEAEDMAQEVFLKLWQQCDRLNGLLKNVEGYLFIMARNGCHNRYKKELRKKPLYKHYCRTLTDAFYHDEVLAKEINRITIQAVKELPAKQKKVFIYRDMGLGRREIADIMKVSVNTIDTCISLAVKRVQQYVSRELDLSTAA